MEKTTIGFHGEKKATVADLIEALSKFDPNALVVGNSNNFELNGSLVGISYIGEYFVQKEMKNFVDGFDHGAYTKEVFTINFDENKKSNAIIISF